MVKSTKRAIEKLTLILKKGKKEILSAKHALQESTSTVLLSSSPSSSQGAPKVRNRVRVRV
jgi:hypothetical protein